MNKRLFQSTFGAPLADTENEAGGRAYSLPPKAALAQLAATSCLNGAYYCDEEAQLKKIVELGREVEAQYLAQVAVYARSRAYMKDMPAILCAMLAGRKETALLGKIFPRVIDNGKMLRNFCQAIRSGVFGRKSFGTAVKRMIRQWLASKTEDQLFRWSVGNDPSMADVIKMIHPKPKSPSRAALYGYLIGKEVHKEVLPGLVLAFEAYKQQKEGPVPPVPFQMLTALDLGTEQWTEIARNASWQMTRMNLNTFERHGVLDDPKMVELIADRLRDPERVRKSRCFPYQLLMAYVATETLDSLEIKEALQEALDVATENVPEIPGDVWVMVDVSGSMGSPITGHRKGATTNVRCVDVAALIGASIVRNNKRAKVIPFEGRVRPFQLNPRDSVMTNARLLASLLNNGTDCSLALQHVNEKKANADLVIYVSDNESWMDSTGGRAYDGRVTGMMAEWQKLKRRCPKAKLVCIDLQPYTTTQASEREDILNIGGFSDQVFNVIAAFASAELGADHWVGEIEKIEI